MVAVKLIAWTSFNPYALQSVGYVPHYELDLPEEMFEPVSDPEGTYKFTDEYDAWMRNRPEDPDELAEAAGRLCYKSWNRPNPATATTEGYLANIIKQGHFSVLEHASATFYISGVSRSFTHELIRHRHFSYSQLSQRYVDQTGSTYIVPPVFNQLDVSERDDLVSELASVHAYAQTAYSYISRRLMELGFSRKEARGAARAVLPEATETEIVVTGNLRAWREFLPKRLSPAADAEIREVAQDLLRELKDLAPASFQDLDTGVV